DVARLIYRRCSGCHRPGGGAPFSLETCNDLRKRGQQIALVTGSRLMPPWKPEAPDAGFQDARRLESGELDLLQTWGAGGMPEGEGRPPAAPRFAAGWQLGAPDMVLEMRQPFAVPAEGPDLARTFALPLNLEEDRWLRAVEFRPGNPGVVRHARFDM